MRRRHHAQKMQGGKRLSDRQGKSFFLVLVFLALFICMVLLQVFFVDDNKGGGEDRLLKILGFGSGAGSSVRVARELTRIQSETEDDAIRASNTSRDRTTPPDHWQSVRGTKDKFYVYSAYYDDRRGRFVRIIAAARTRMADKVLCIFWFRDGRRPSTVFATNKLIRENWNLKYSAYFVLCPLKGAALPVPHAVSVLRHGDRNPSNRLVVHDNRGLYRRPEGIAVCVKPLHYHYNKFVQLVEFLELNRLLGVRHFVFYNHTVGRDAGCVLDSMAAERRLTLLPWQLNMVSQKEIRTEGLFAALNECLYRTMYRFRFVLMIDLDEFVVPRRNRTLSAMLSTLLRNNPDRAGAYSFQNAFFYLQWPSDAASRSLQHPLVTLQKTMRKAKLHAHKQRSKCIVLPERIVEMGNHFVWEFVPGRTMFNIPPDIGFLHHYRVCEFGGNDCVNTSHLVDRRVYAWRDGLVHNVAVRLRQLHSLCNFPSQ